MVVVSEWMVRARGGPTRGERERKERDLRLRIKMREREEGLES